ncbi:DsbA family oxidoreductase [Clostridium paraputrificum]|uniref:DsbA family oxidoreductase n=1 Tax=Clostridium TaxID=1485 RepID=UPI003D346242
MKVEIWSDIFCPFCYIGKRKFEMALEEFSNKSEVEVVYRSFELNPSSPKHYNEDINGLIASKYGITYEEAKRNNENIIKQAANVGLTYNFDTLIPTNSFDAHRMIHFASKYGKMNEITEKLFIAYFTDSKDISDHKILADIAESIGLDRYEALNTLASNDYKKEVRADEEEASRLGITGVPFFVFNGKFAVSGAQPTNVFLNTLEKVLEDEKPEDSFNEESNEESCVGGVCPI